VNWNDLRYFVELARQKRMLHVGRKLGVDHTTVARRIEQLEKDLGCKLFESAPDGYRLTDAGARMANHAELVESTVERLCEEVGGESVTVSGTVRVGVPEGLGTHFLAQRLGRLFEANPDLQIEMLSLPRFPSLATREADIIVSLSQPENSRCVAARLTDFSYGLFATPEYLAKHGPITERDQLRAHPLIGYVPDYLPSPLLDYMDDLQPEGGGLRFSSTGMLAQLEACKAGYGVAVLAHYLVVNSGLVEILPGEMHWERSFWIMALSDSFKLRRVREVWDYMREVVEAEPQYFRLGSTAENS